MQLVWLWIWDEMFCTKLESWLVHTINPGCFCFSFQRASAFDVPLSISLQSPFFLSGFGCIFCGCGESCVGVLVQIELHSVLLQQETHCTRNLTASSLRWVLSLLLFRSREAVTDTLQQIAGASALSNRFPLLLSTCCSTTLRNLVTIVQGSWLVLSLVDLDSGQNNTCSCAASNCGIQEYICT